MWIFGVLFVLGLGLGVVINSLADNLPPDADDMRYPARRPRCRTCQTPHRPVYWLALAALVGQGGCCEHCGARRPARAWLVELASGAGTALIWAWAIYRTQQNPETASNFILVLRYLGGLAVFQSMLLVTVIDVEHRLILWNVVWPSALVLFWFGLVLPEHGLVKALLGGLAGYGITLGIFLMAELYARLIQRWRGQPLDEVAFGGGDVNLAGLVGLAVGWPGIILALLIAVLAGGAFSLVYIVVQLARRRYSPHSAIPYGPFLVLGCLVLYFVGRDLSVFVP